MLNIQANVNKYTNNQVNQINQINKNNIINSI